MAKKKKKQKKPLTNLDHKLNSFHDNLEMIARHVEGEINAIDWDREDSNPIDDFMRALRVCAGTSIEFEHGFEAGKRHQRRKQYTDIEEN